MFPGVVAALVLLDHVYKYVHYVLVSYNTHMFSCWVHPVPVYCFLCAASDTANVPHLQTKLGRTINRERPTWVGKIHDDRVPPHTAYWCHHSYYIINGVINTYELLYRAVQSKSCTVVDTVLIVSGTKVLHCVVIPRTLECDTAVEYTRYQRAA